MASVAEQLCQAREHQKLSVYDVAEVTKIKTDHIRALEQGDYSAFAAPIYIRGFVRTYASMLHLDVPKVMGDLEAELNASEQFQETAFSAEPQRTIFDDLLSVIVTRLNWRIILVLGILTGVFVLGMWAYGAWEERRSRPPAPQLGPGLYTPSSPGEGNVLPLPIATNTSPN